MDLHPVWHTLCIYISEEQIFIKLKEMKKSIITSVLAVLATLATVSGQNYPKEYLGLPGDNLNLYAVMDLFRNSPTLEDFERGLNDRDSRINNLDLNGDWRVDYIAVSDYRDGNVHTIVLRAMLGRKEYQDVAVITVERLRRNKIRIQIIGDQALYGRNYIIEPLFAKNKKARYYNDPVYYGRVKVYNNVWWDMYDWPVVVYIYSPYYSGWSSSWYWGYYPEYWSPWRPYYWDYYYGYHSGWHNHYYSHYHHTGVPRYHRYNDFYYSNVRQESPQVQRRVAEGNYRQTYSRPELRSEGEALYNRTHKATVEGTRSQAPANTPSRREAAPRPVEGRSTSAGSDAGRRVATDPGSDNRGTAEARDAERRSAETRSVQVKAAEERVARDRTAEQRAAESRAAEQRAAESRAADQRAAESRATEQRAAESRAAQVRANEERAAQARASEQRAAESRAAEQRAAESRATEQRAAESRAAEQRAAESRAAEQRAAESRAAEQRAAESRAAEARASESRAAEQRAAEQRAAQSRANEERAAEARRAEAARSTTIPPADGTGRSARK